jgi:hypothetical protein
MPIEFGNKIKYLNCMTEFCCCWLHKWKHRFISYVINKEKKIFKKEIFCLGSVRAPLVAFLQYSFDSEKKKIKTLS